MFHESILTCLETFAVVINSKGLISLVTKVRREDSSTKYTKHCCRTQSFCQWGELVSLSCIALLPRDIDGMTPDGSEVHLFPSQPFPNGHLAS